MKVFVATEPIDEDREFSFTIPGELVHLPPLICDCPHCGCDRAMAGFVSHMATTSPPSPRGRSTTDQLRRP